MDLDIELAILALLRNRTYYNQYSGLIQPTYFQSDTSRNIWRYIQNYFEKYPERQMASKRNLRLMADSTGDERKVEIGVIRKLNFTDSDIEVIQDRIKQFAKHGITSSMIRKNLPALEGKVEFDIDAMVAQLQAAKDLDIIGDKLYDYVEETESFHRTFTPGGEPIPTGVYQLDEVIRDPPSTQEMWTIMGPPGRGKTQWLLNMCVNAARIGKRALYITAGDQGRLRIQRRLDSMISGISYQNLSDPTNRIMGLLRKRVRENIIKTGGRIYIQDWSETSCTPAQVRGVVEMMEGNLDLIAVDYPMIMRSNSRYQERRHEIASINSDLRKIAVKYDLLIWAGAQTNRSALDKKKFDMKELAEDIQQAWVADGIMAFCQTEDEKADELARLLIVKARRPPLKSYEVPVQVDPETGRVI